MKTLGIGGDILPFLESSKETKTNNDGLPPQGFDCAEETVGEQGQASMNAYNFALGFKGRTVAMPIWGCQGCHYSSIPC